MCTCTALVQLYMCMEVPFGGTIAFTPVTGPERTDRRPVIPGTRSIKIAFLGSNHEFRTSCARAHRSSRRFQIASSPWFTCRRRGRFCRGQPPRRRDDATTPFNETSLQTRGANPKRMMKAIAKKNAASLLSRI